MGVVFLSVGVGFSFVKFVSKEKENSNCYNSSERIQSWLGIHNAFAMQLYSLAVVCFFFMLKIEMFDHISKPVIS